jgi:hypothetical protein
VRSGIRAEAVGTIADLLQGHPTDTLKDFLFILDPDTESASSPGTKMTLAEFTQIIKDARTREGDQAVQAELEKRRFIILGGNHGFLGRMELLHRLGGDKDKFKKIKNAYFMRGAVVVAAPVDVARKVRRPPLFLPPSLSGEVNNEVMNFTD